MCLKESTRKEGTHESQWLVMVSRVLSSSKVQEAVGGRKRERPEQWSMHRVWIVGPRNCPVSMQRNNEESREGSGQFWAMVSTESENGPLWDFLSQHKSTDRIDWIGFREEWSNGIVAVAGETQARVWQGPWSPDTKDHSAAFAAG